MSFRKKSFFNLLQSGLFIATLIFGTKLVFAQSDVLIDLSMETQPEVRIAVPEFEQLKGSSDSSGLGREGREILENDLKLFELFQPVRHSAYSSQASRERGTGKVDYSEWNGLGVQWLIKTQYQVASSGSNVFIFRLYDVVNERFIVGKRYRGKRQWVRRMMHRFADEVMAQLTGKRGVAETQIAFLAQQGKSGKEMYVVDFDGYNLKKVTREQSVMLAPDWSPDGKAIVFTSYRDHNPDLVMVDRSGKKRKVLLQLPGLNSAPAWSPDGEKIALVLSKDQNSEIYLLDKFANLKRLTKHFNIDTSPAWSPDGRKIAFASDRSGTGAPQIFIMDARSGDSGGVKRISFSASYNDNPAWSPTGDKIAYTALVNRKFQVKIYDLEKNQTYDLTTGGGNKEAPAWSPDGQFVAYRVEKGGNSTIHIKRVGSKKSRSLTFPPLTALSPTWSPYSR
ncbi:MAG: Tol-Pal system beta propeller repeat protein TolB [Candidatus Nitronauta litoralis]|uniref:Tol-Pal system beta propeller repeat protein TolB n=1 Tax=Candidatus Nitronauta litoralis TaxID=2705533 RepID=A0A7T0G0G2_9BACT|nr:MAG: Tol-Pal system beta propeller repeat protein TolB [Candidatus Nitronauta litoralis]